MPSSWSGSFQALVTACRMAMAVAAAVGCSMVVRAWRMPLVPKVPVLVRRWVMPSVTRMRRSPDVSWRLVGVKVRSWPRRRRPRSPPRLAKKRPRNNGERRRGMQTGFVCDHRVESDACRTQIVRLLDGEA